MAQTAPTTEILYQNGQVKIPAELIVPHLENLDFTLSTNPALHVILSRIRSGRQKYVILTTADKLLCEANKAEAWRFPPLEFFYWEGKVPPDMSKPVQCAARECENWFSLVPHGMHKKYCSSTCGARESQYRRKIRTRPDQRKCTRGHDVTHRNKFGRCGTCKRERQVEKRKALAAAA
jgi:hypothetical protein